jgi:REP element-mobilizing transposase RayT
MPSTWCQNYYHAVFSTKNRVGLITPEIESRLHPFLAGIVNDLGCQPVAINGMTDHVHLLVQYRSDLSHSEMLRHVKGRSSKWLNETFSSIRPFHWQEGYGGFTVSRSLVPKVKAYIEGQKEHHKEMDFDTEFKKLLELHGLSV